MRPLELELRNFRSYFGGGHLFDFRGRGLVGIVGPIGSGKSSLLDAISFALYGKTSSGGAKTKALIHQRASDGGVRLRFEVEGEVWEVVRSLRRKGASQHALYRFETDDDEDPVERHTLEGDVNGAIAALLGLDYEAFGRSVLLAQGRFAEFLQAPPAERDAVLKGVFGHDRIDAMREIAKLRSLETQSELEKLAVRTEQLERVAARMVGTKDSLEAAESRVELLRKLEPRLQDVDSRLAGAAQERERAHGRIEELQRHVSRLPAPGTTADLVKQAQASAAERIRLAAALEDAQSAVATADEALAAAEKAGTPQRLEEAARLLATADPQRRAHTEATARASQASRRVDELAAGLATAQSELEAAASRVTGADEAVAAAQDELAAARTAVHEAEHADMAAVLRTELVVGEPCPVCTRDVVVVPPGAFSDLEAARQRLETAQRTHVAAEERRRTASAAHTSAERECASLESGLAAARDEVARAQRDLAAATEDLAETTRELGRLLGEGDPARLLASEREAFASLGVRVAETRRIADQVRSNHDRAILDEQEVGRQLAGLRIEIADLAARLGRPVKVAADGAAGIGRAVEELRLAWEEELAALETARRAAGDEERRAQEDRTTLLEQAGVSGDFAAALGAADATVAHLQQQVADDTAELAAAADLLETRARLETQLARYQRLAADLTNARFVRFLLDDERTRLGHLGSDHFLRLSSGRYEFTDDGTFSIVDLTAADAVRKAASLSGGETFLASLALALSLAEMVTRTGGRLDAFFLDEGFGSLDPEHLDLAMEGIEALVADHAARLVVVVSHVPELRHRIEDLIRLDRDPLTGDTKVLQS